MKLFLIIIVLVAFFAPGVLVFIAYLPDWVATVVVVIAIVAYVVHWLRK